MTFSISIRCSFPGSCMEQLQCNHAPGSNSGETLRLDVRMWDRAESHPIVQCYRYLAARSQTMIADVKRADWGSDMLPPDSTICEHAHPQVARAGFMESFPLVFSVLCLLWSTRYPQKNRGSLGSNALVSRTSLVNQEHISSGRRRE